MEIDAGGYAANMVAEAGVIGAILLDEKQLAKVRTIVTDSDFSAPEYADIFRAACEAADEGKPVDFIVLNTTVDKRVAMQAMEVVKVTANAEEYAKEVKAHAIRRALADLSEQTIMGISQGENVDVLVRNITKFSEELKPVGSNVISSSDALKEFMRYRQKLDKYGRMYVPTGFKDLDELLGGGLVNAGFYIIAARPGMGKTTLAAAVADNVAKSGRETIFYSLEMSTEQMSARRLGRNAGIPYTKLMLGKLDEMEYAKIAAAASKLSGVPLYLRATQKLTPQDVDADIREKKPDVVVIDYIGLMTPPRGKRSRYEEMTELSSEMKRLAMRHKIPILCLAQLNRETTQTADKRPNMAQLRDSGALEQDADGIIFLHRPAYYEQSQQQNEHELIEVIVAKNRHGRTGFVEMQWYGATGIILPIWRG